MFCSFFIAWIWLKTLQGKLAKEVFLTQPAYGTQCSKDTKETNGLRFFSRN